jgi:hypothetical protein
MLSLRWAQVDLDGGMIDFRTPGASITNARPDAAAAEAPGAFAPRSIARDRSRLRHQ